MDITQVLQDLEKVEDLIGDLKFAAQIAEDQDLDVNKAIQEFTKRDPSLLGEVQNLACLIR